VVLSDTVRITLTTDANGYYSFTNLPADTYEVFVDPDELGPGGSLEDWFAVNPDPPEYTVILDSGEFTDTIDFGFDVTTSFVITKVLNTVGLYGIIRPGDPLSYTITIKNTGATTMTTVPLSDTYDTAFLQYGVPLVGPTTFSNPLSDDTVDDGEIYWSDLTSPAGWNADLGPGESNTVVVWFTALQDSHSVSTDVTTNTATAMPPTVDPPGPPGVPPQQPPVPPEEDDEPVEITDPTAAEMAGFGAEAAADGVQVSWQTANELNIMGFNVLRSRNVMLSGASGASSGPVLAPVKLNDALILARYAGEARGAAYSFLDEGAALGPYRYMLEVVQIDGRTRRYGFADVRIQ
jgi:hypothetical protein